MGKSILKENVLRKLSKVFKDFKNVLDMYNDDYAFLRGELFSTKSGNLGMQFVISDIEGRLKVTQLEYDPETEDLYTTKKIHFTNEKAVCDGIYSLGEVIQSLGVPVSRVYFELCQSFFKGTAEEDPQEPGSMIFYLLGNDTDNRLGINYSSLSSKNVDRNLFGEKWEGVKEN